MSDAKPLATLTPTLLARKGGARPAMRQQLQPLQDFHDASTREMNDDLGWNDMGSDEPSGQQPAVASAEILSIAGEPGKRKKSGVVPLVVQQQDRLSRRIDAGGRRPAAPKGRRTAFTLRLDAERHFKLRLASTILGRSAQDIVAAALDDHIAAMSDIEALAAKIRNVAD